MSAHSVVSSCCIQDKDLGDAIICQAVQCMFIITCGSITSGSLGLEEVQLDVLLCTVENLAAVSVVDN